MKKQTTKTDETAIAGSLLLAADLDQSQMCDQSEPDIDYHLKRVKAIQSNAFEKEKGNLMARVFLRNTGSRNDHKGNYIINEKDLFAWFENLDYLKSYTEYDTL